MFKKIFIDDNGLITLVTYKNFSIELLSFFTIGLVCFGLKKRNLDMKHLVL